ncbi:MAG: hypothetical protein V9F46_11630 [Chitinophagaceae bacterium]
MNKKLNKKLSAGTKADSSTKDEDLLSSPANAKPNVVGSQSRVVSLKKNVKYLVKSRIYE